MLPLFIVDSISDSKSISLPDDEARHAITSLRIKVGERIAVTDGFGNHAEVRIDEVTKRVVRGEILTRSVEAPSPVDLIVIQALTKGDRAREAIELLTEGGVTSIIPWSASRSIGKWNGEMLQRWQTWGREATKQSRRNWIPRISDCVTTKEIIELIPGVDSALLFHEAGGKRIVDVIPKNAKRVVIIIGPEGGIDENELELLISAGAVQVTMGTPVLRAAHAGLAALAATQTILELW